MRSAKSSAATWKRKRRSETRKGKKKFEGIVARAARCCSGRVVEGRDNARRANKHNEPTLSLARATPPAARLAPLHSTSAAARLIFNWLCTNLNGKIKRELPPPPLLYRTLPSPSPRPYRARVNSDRVLFLFFFRFFFFLISKTLICIYIYIRRARIIISLRREYID